MNKLWQFLNTPLIVVLVALVLWPIMGALSSGIAVKLGIRQVADAVSKEIVKPIQQLGKDQDEELKMTADVLNQIVISNVRFAPTSWPKQVKIIGTITNKSDKTVKSIHLLVSMYEGGALVDVSNAWLSNLKLLKPSESSNFSVTSDIEEGKDPSLLRMDLKVADLGIITK